MQKMLLALSVGLLPSTLPVRALAEGATTILDCQITSRCDAAGACVPVAEPVRFTLKPIKIGPLGAGVYRVSYDGVSARLTLPEDDGPMTWSETGTDRQSLRLISETPDRRGNLVWQSRTRADAAPAETRHLTCLGVQ